MGLGIYVALFFGLVCVIISWNILSSFLASSFVTFLALFINESHFPGIKIQGLLFQLYLQKGCFLV